MAKSSAKSSASQEIHSDVSRRDVEKETPSLTDWPVRTKLSELQIMMNNELLAAKNSETEKLRGNFEATYRGQSGLAKGNSCPF